MKEMAVTTLFETGIMEGFLSVKSSAVLKTSLLNSKLVFAEGYAFNTQKPFTQKNVLKKRMISLTLCKV